MWIQSKITLIAVSLVMSLHVTVAWLPPERCEQGRRSRVYAAYSDSSPTSVPVGNITETARNQNQNLVETYGNAKFFGVPISGHSPGCLGCSYTAHVPRKCKFYTYSPRLLSSVQCHKGLACKLAHTVATSDSYTASEGYNWGVKISTKLSLFEKVFEVGGEVSINRWNIFVRLHKSEDHDRQCRMCTSFWWRQYTSTL